MRRESWKTGGGGGGGGAVEQVDGQTGIVDLSGTYQARDTDLNVIAALDSSQSGVIASDGAGWIRKAYSALKTAMSLSKGDVGLGNVDNTTDLGKPVSTATQTALNAKADLVGGTVPSGQLPSYVDDVIEAANFAALPGTGVAGKIYVTLDDNKTYRWSGTAYVVISDTIALGETSASAYRGDRGKTAYDHSQLTNGNPHAVTKGDVGLGSVDNTSDAGKPVSTAQQTALDAKVAKSLYDANTILIADADDTPTALAVGASRIIGRKASGGIGALTVAEVAALLGGTAAGTLALGDDARFSAGGTSPVKLYTGDGSDGAVAMDGTNTYASFASKSGSTYTLTRDVFATTFVVSSGVTLVTANFIIHASTSVTNGGTIHNDGNDGANATGATGAGAGAATAVGTLNATFAGGIGGVSGSNGTATANTSAGGAGGAGGAGANAGGTGGAVTATTAANSGWKVLPTFATGVSVKGATSTNPISGGGGGGGGGGSNPDKGAGGGAGGGLVIINTPTLINNGAIHARGGAGGVQVTAGLNCGGGGGGGGGAVMINTSSAVTGTGTIDANGGNGGASNGTGAAGTNGSAGNVYQKVW